MNLCEIRIANVLFLFASLHFLLPLVLHTSLESYSCSAVSRFEAFTSSFWMVLNCFWTAWDYSNKTASRGRAPCDCVRLTDRSADSYVLNGRVLTPLASSPSRVLVFDLLLWDGTRRTVLCCLKSNLLNSDNSYRHSYSTDNERHYIRMLFNNQCSIWENYVLFVLFELLWMAFTRQRGLSTEKRSLVYIDLLYNY